jgi:hypothetical protein
MYKLFKFSGATEPQLVNRTNDDGSVTCIPFDPANTDYQAYLAWLEAGNTPEPADEGVSQ